MRIKKISALLIGLEDKLRANKELVAKNGVAALKLSRSEHSISRKNISPAVLRTLYRLHDAGYQAYLVGGCIRDLLLGKAPKDFDVSTDARPEQVRRLFPNSRIIGKRFKIVHVMYGNEIIEVTTFRASAEDTTEKFTVQSREGMLVRDNSYGDNIEDDASRRDFTINAIYYDISDFSLSDFHGGLYDLTHGVIDIIGDPDKRYQEDPVRMIRAIRFKAKLGFEISERTEEPIFRLAPLLLNISNARMFDEVNKLFLTGHGLQSFRELQHYDLIRLLFPGQDEFVDTPKFNSFIEYALSSSDLRSQQGKRNKPHFLYTMFLWSKIEQGMKRLDKKLGKSNSKMSLHDKVYTAVTEAINDQYTVIAIPQVITGDIMVLIQLVYQLTDPELDAREIESTARKPLFRAAFDLIKLRARFEPEVIPYVKFWQYYYDIAQEQLEEAKRRREEKEQRRKEKRQARRDKARRRRENRSKERAMSVQDREPLDLTSAPEFDTPAVNTEVYQGTGKGKNKDKDRSKKKDKAKKPNPAALEFEKESARERQERLERARAWRISMNLEP